MGCLNASAKSYINYTECSVMSMLVFPFILQRRAEEHSPSSNRKTVFLRFYDAHIALKDHKCEFIYLIVT